VPAVVVLAVLEARGAASFGHAGTGHALLMVGVGAITAVPLLLFAAAARRVPLSTVGLLQYVNPSIQLLLAVFVLSEPLPPVRLAGFAIVWLALAVYTVDGLRAARSERRSAEPVVPAGA
jgi:chloramphenicol-sensitive protein RarD